MKNNQFRNIFLFVLISTTIVFLAFRVYLYVNHRYPRSFLETETDYYIFDQEVGHIHRPNARRVCKFPEYPKKIIKMNTNNFGFREDRETQVEKNENTIRILVTGDSHTDGVVENRESFPNILENKLNQSAGSERFDVINAGVGYYTFQNYAGVLRKNLFLKPDWFIVTIYSGNDFIEGVITDSKSGLSPANRTPIWQRLKLHRTNPGLRWQGLNQIVYFKSYPDMKDLAVKIAQRELNSVSTLCRENNIRLLVLFLPPKYEIESLNQLEQEVSRFELLEEDKNLSRQLSIRLMALLKRENIDYLDISEEFLKSDGGLYWEADHHLSAKGHAKIAELLYGKVNFEIYQNQ